MFTRIGLAAFLVFAPITIAVAAEPIGHYSVKGKSPDGGDSYSGSVVISKTGDTYKVVWTIGDETYVGTGIGNDEFLAVSYKSGDNSGLALYGEHDKNWEGVWTYSGGTKIGTEVWTRTED